MEAANDGTNGILKAHMNVTIRESIEASDGHDQENNLHSGTYTTLDNPPDHHQTNHQFAGALPSSEEDDVQSESDSADGGSSSSQGNMAADVRAYAKLEFADGDFYMTTHAVELGRESDETRSRTKYLTASDNEIDLSLSDDPQEDQEPGFSLNDRRRTSTGSSRKHPRKDYNSVAVPPSSDPANPDNTNLIFPNDCPLIPISPPETYEGRPGNHKSISRRHIRISFNFEKYYFEITFLGRNGGFLDEEYFAGGTTEPLVSGSVIQIGGLGIRFYLPEVPLGETGADEVRGQEYEPLEEDEEEIPVEEDEIEGEASEPSDLEQDEKMETRNRGRRKPKPEPEPETNRRKGPGRPPKNGIMSKREQAELARQAKAKAKNRTSGQKHGRGKTAKAVELEGSSLQPSGKRKYTKRKKSRQDEEQGARESTEKTESEMPEQDLGIKASKVQKERKPAKPPRSPSPEMRAEDYTEEQLQKPPASYVILIHEALTSSESGHMSLPQIYKAIERRHPFFKFRVTTQGWQSSVRHNLGQHQAFRKIEREGKGWMWGYDETVSIEREKKRRATPPPTTTSQSRYFPQQPAPQSQPTSYQHPLMQYSKSYVPPNGMPQMNGYHIPPGMQHSPLPPRPPFAAPANPLNMILNATKSDSSYKSPYDTSSNTNPRPSDPVNPQLQATPQTNGINGHSQSHEAIGQQTRPHYPNGQPNNNLSSNVIFNPLSQNGALTPGWEASGSKLGINERTMDELRKFKKTMLNECNEQLEVSQLIDSAIDRVVNVCQQSSMPSNQYQTQEETIMATVDKLLKDIKAADENDQKAQAQSEEMSVEKRSGTADDPTGAKAAAAIAPSISLGGRRSSDHESNGVNQTNGLKHARTPSATDDIVQQAKRRSG